MLLNGGAAAEGPTPPLREVLVIRELDVQPEATDGEQPFVLTARLTNTSKEELRDLRWYPSVLADPAKPADHPEMEIVARTPPTLDLRGGASQVVSLRFVVRSAGSRRYGLLVETADTTRGPVFAAFAEPRRTIPSQVGGVSVGTLWSLLIGALLVSLAVFVARSHAFRTRLREQVDLAPARQDVVPILVWCTLLLLGLGGASVMSFLYGIGVPSVLLDWTIFVLIPVRWLLPPAASIGLARTQLPTALVALVILSAYFAANANLIGRVSANTLLELCLPGIALTLVVAGLRLTRWPMPARSLELVGLGWYLVAAYPSVTTYQRLLAGAF